MTMYTREVAPEERARCHRKMPRACEIMDLHGYLYKLATAAPPSMFDPWAGPEDAARLRSIFDERLAEEKLAPEASREAYGILAGELEIKSRRAWRLIRRCDHLAGAWCEGYLMAWAGMVGSLYGDSRKLAHAARILLAQTILFSGMIDRVYDVAYRYSLRKWFR